MINRMRASLKLTACAKRAVGIALLPSSLLINAILPSNAIAAKPNQYPGCVTTLKDSGVDKEQASIACADAIVPKDLAACVAKLDTDTPITGETALPACFKVRRPLDLATCVIGINGSTTGADPNAILDYCRRSLLPISFSQCVVGLTEAAPIPSTEALDHCIDAEDFPRGLLSGESSTSQ